MKVAWLVLAACGSAPAPDAEPLVPTLAAAWTFSDCTGTATTCDTFPGGPAVTLDFMLTPVTGDPHLVGGSAPACAGSALLGVNAAKYSVAATAKRTDGAGIGVGSGTTMPDFSFPNTGVLHTQIAIRPTSCN